MNMLAAECRISKANIYHYYSGKDALLFDLLDCYLVSLRDQIQGLELLGKTPEQQLRLLVREILTAYQGRDHEHRVQISTLHVLPQEQQTVLRGYQKDLVRTLRQCIARIAPDALARDKPKLRAITMSVFGMLNWFFMWHGEADQTARDKYAQLVCDLVLDGIRDGA